MGSALKNIVVVGASFLGTPRYAVVPGHEHKAFIPYTKYFSSQVKEHTRHGIITAKALAVHPDYVTLDTPFEGSTDLPYAYLTIATGTQLSQPSNMPSNDKKAAVAYLQDHQRAVKRAKKIVIVGGGAVGVQMATDIKEWFPEKEVTVVQSRARLMPKFHEKLHEIVKERFDELGVKLITNARAKIPVTVPDDGSTFDLPLTTGETITADFLIRATGQTPNTQLLNSLKPSSSEPLINPENGFIRVKPTLQLTDPKYPNIFSVGDIADSGARKTVKAALPQVSVVAKNILQLTEGREADKEFKPTPFGIHLSLGKTKNVVFRDPATEGEEPTVIHRTDGTDDMGVTNMWTRFGFEKVTAQQYHL
ncbi:hypothetical protein KEM56_007272 [Ascosphaera pollenicola]|nr:hypothetical protein KEM56_007272 [Ascosphaera pollenicola]